MLHWTNDISLARLIRTIACLHAASEEGLSIKCSTACQGCVWRLPKCARDSLVEKDVLLAETRKPDTGQIKHSDQFLSSKTLVMRTCAQIPERVTEPDVACTGILGAGHSLCVSYSRMCGMRPVSQPPESSLSAAEILGLFSLA